MEKAALEDEGVKAELAKLQLPEGTVVISDPWIYGAWIRQREVQFTNISQDPMASTMVCLLMLNACFNAFSTFEIQRTLQKRIVTIMLCLSAYPPLLAPRL